MQLNQLSHFLAMLWASGSLLPEELCAASARLAAREIFEAEHTAQVSTESELTSAIQNPEIFNIVLTNDIITMSDIIINRQTPLTLDLHAYKIASLRASAAALDVQTGSLTITGQGSIVANGLNSSGIRLKGAMTAENVHYSNLTVDEQVTIYAPHAYGIYLAANFQAAYGVEITLKGKIVARNGVGINRLVQGQGEHVPKIIITDTATLETDTDTGVALSAAGLGNWQIGAAEITGATGASVKAGELQFTQTKITATGELTNPSGWDSSVGVGAVVQIEENSAYAGNIRLRFAGGEYTSRQSYFVAKYGSATTLRSLEISAGTFTVPSGVFYGVAPDTDTTTSTVVVSGGDFVTSTVAELTDYLPKGFYLSTAKSTGITTVVDPNPPEVQIDPVERLALECATLENLITHAQTYLDKNRVGNELGEWQDMANKATGIVRRAVKAGQKLLQGTKEITLDQVLHLQKRLKTAMQGVEKVADEMRGEMLSVLTTAQELDPHDYSAYSYNALKEAIIAALVLTAQPEASLNQLYSVFCDLQLNIDLLEEPENELDIDLSNSLPAPVVSEQLEDPALTASEQRQIAELETSVVLSALDQEFLDNPATEPVITNEDSAVAVEDDAPEPMDELALAALNDARSNLYFMVDAVQDLALKDYQAEYAEQFGELQVAIVNAQAILRKAEATLPEILDAMDELKFATAGLQLEDTTAPEPAQITAKSLPESNTKHHTRLGTIALAAMSKSTQPSAETDWSALREVVADIAKLNADDYTASTYANVLNNLERAKVLLASVETEQSDIDDLVFELNLALLALERNVQTPVSQQFLRPIINSTRGQSPADTFANQDVAPNLLMSMMAGAYAGLATYRRSRLEAKKRKVDRKLQLFSKV